MSNFLDEDGVTRLQSHLMLNTATATLLSTGWVLSNDVYQYDLTVSGDVKPSVNTVFISLGSVSNTNFGIIQKCNIRYGSSPTSTTIRFIADKQPSVDVPVNIVYDRKSL